MMIMVNRFYALQDMESKITDVCQSAMDKLSENSVQLSKLQADVEGTKVGKMLCVLKY